MKAVRLLLLCVFAFSLVLGDDFTDYLYQADTLEEKALEFGERQVPQVGPVSKYKAVAKKDIKEGEIVYQFPYSQMITVEAAMDDAALGESFKVLSRKLNNKEFITEAEDTEREMLFDDQILKLYLIHIRNTPSSPWNSYLKTFPESFETPHFWENDEIDQLEGSEVRRVIYQTIATIKDEYSRMFPKLTERFPELYPADVYTLEAYKWAYVLYSSRSWYKDDRNPVLPLIEVFNYKDESHVEVIQEDDLIKLVAKKDISQGEGVLINEQRLSNRDLLLAYGFVLEKNPEDYIPVGLGLQTDDKLFGNKLKLFHEYGIQDGDTYRLKDDGIPKDLLFALRVYHTTVYDYEDIQNAKKGESVSLHNEKKVGEMLVQLCQTSLRNYPTTGKEDKALLKTDLPPRVRNAVILRRGEKRVLFKTLTFARNALDQVRAKWLLRPMDIPDDEHLRAVPISEQIL